MAGVEPWDAVICGGGPAGALTAIRLLTLRPALRVVLLEAATVARLRPCGEFIAPLGCALLAAAGLGGVVAAAESHGEPGAGSRLQGLSLHAGRRRLDLPFTRSVDGHGGAGLGLRREVLGEALLERAAACGAVVRRGERLLQGERNTGRWRLSTSSGATLESWMLVGADGRLSRVRHLAGLDRPVARHRLAVVARARGLRMPAGSPHGEMHLSALGQIGVAPLGGGLVNLNLLLAPAAHRLVRLRCGRELMAVALRLTPSLRARAHGIRLDAVLVSPRLPHRAHAVTGAGVALVGDAAGFWDPFTGDGIAQALLHGWDLAGCLAQCRAGRMPARSELAPYARAWAAATAAKRPGLLEPLLDRRALAEAVIGLLSAVPALGALLAYWSLPSRRFGAICSATEKLHGSTRSPLGRPAGAG